MIDLPKNDEPIILNSRPERSIMEITVNPEIPTHFDISLDFIPCVQTCADDGSEVRTYVLDEGALIALLIEAIQKSTPLVHFHTIEDLQQEEKGNEDPLPRCQGIKEGLPYLEAITLSDEKTSNEFAVIERWFYPQNRAVLFMVDISRVLAKQDGTQKIHATIIKLTTPCLDYLTRFYPPAYLKVGSKCYTDPFRMERSKVFKTQRGFYLWIKLNSTLIHPILPVEWAELKYRIGQYIKIYFSHFGIMK